MFTAATQNPFFCAELSFETQASKTDLEPLSVCNLRSSNCLGIQRQKTLAEENRDKGPDSCIGRRHLNESEISPSLNRDLSGLPDPARHLWESKKVKV